MRLLVAVFLATMTVARAPFGTLPGGGAVEVFTLRNANGVEVRAMTYGATIISVRVPDRAGRLDDVVLGFDNLADYLTVAEGVSHFVYVAWNAAFDKPVTLLELELQAEIDKYVLCAWLLREQGAGRFPRELHRALFERVRIDPAAGDRAGLYEAASWYAQRFCGRVARSLARGTRTAMRELLTELRRFYRLGNARKLRYIERCA